MDLPHDNNTKAYTYNVKLECEEFGFSSAFQPGQFLHQDQSNFLKDPTEIVPDITRQNCPALIQCIEILI